MQTQREQLQNSIKSVIQKLQLINYQNLQPPYLPQTLSQLRKSHLSPYLPSAPIPELSNQALTKWLHNINQIITNFDEKQVKKYSQLLMEAYMKKLRREGWEIDGVGVGQIQRKFRMRKEVKDSLFWVARWFVEVEIMRDLFQRVQLYFRVDLPQFVWQLEDKLTERMDVKNNAKTYLATARKALSLTLSKTSQIISSSLFTSIISSALLLTIALLQNTTIPLQMKLNSKCFIPAGLVATIPPILQSLSNCLTKQNTHESLQTWQMTFLALTENLHKFNSYLEKAIKLCSLARTKEQYIKQRINLEKIVGSLGVGVRMIQEFQEGRFEEMRVRTQAYFKEYVQVIQGEWVLVVGNEDTNDTGNRLRKGQSKEQQFQLLKLSKQLPNPTDPPTQK